MNANSDKIPTCITTYLNDKHLNENVSYIKINYKKSHRQNFFPFISNKKKFHKKNPTQNHIIENATSENWVYIIQLYSTHLII